MVDARKRDRFENGKGFVAALDQSGGSTPKALALYGVDESQYSGDAEMFDLIQAARARVVASPAFTGERVLAAILFEGTLDREVDGRPVADYLWSVKGIVPFVKIDKGLADRRDDVQLMKEDPGLGELLARAAAQGVHGTKERSVVHAANPDGIAQVLDQQFAVAREVLAAGLVPVVEPEVSIDAPDKERAEELVKAGILTRLAGLGEERVALKLTLPSVDGFYTELVSHPNVARVVALSGGYGRDDANARLARNPGVIASFSRALLDGLTVQQSEEEFDRTLDETIESVYQASIA